MRPDQKPGKDTRADFGMSKQDIIGLNFSKTRNQAELQRGGIDVKLAVKEIAASEVLGGYDRLLASDSGSLLSPGDGFGPYLEMATEMGFFNRKAFLRDGKKAVALGVQLTKESGETLLMLINEKSAWIKSGASEGVVLLDDVDYVRETLESELNWRIGEQKHAETVAEIAKEADQYVERVLPKPTTE